MKKFVSVIIAGALIAGLVSTALSQGAAGPKGQKGGQTKPGAPGGPGQGQGGRRMGMNFLEQIKPPLTADQKSKIQKVMESMRAEFQKLREAPGDRESKRPKMEALRKKQMEAFNKILTKPQQESLKKLQEEMRKRFQQGGGPGGRPGGPPPAGGKPPKGNKPPL